MAEYFSHDVDARNDVKMSQLIQAHGYAGYGLYWAVIELMNQQSDCQLPYDLQWLAWELHAQPETLEHVLKDFGLFEFDEGDRFFWSESARKRLAMRMGFTLTGKKRGRPPKKPQSQTDDPETPPDDCENTPKTAQICANAPIMTSCSITTKKTEYGAKEAISASCPQTVKNAFDEVDHVPDSSCDCGEPNDDEKVLAYWNKVFAGTDRVQRGLCLSSEASLRLHATLVSYDLDEVKKAIDAARRDDYKWYLPAVLKEDNIQRLLTQRIDKNGKSNNADFMAGKQYCDSSGKPCEPGLEFKSPQFWQDFNNASNAESVPF